MKNEPESKVTSFYALSVSGPRTAKTCFGARVVTDRANHSGIGRVKLLFRSDFNSGAEGIGVIAFPHDFVCASNFGT